MPTSHDRIFRAQSVKSSLGMRPLVYPHIQAHRLKSFILLFLLTRLSTSQQQMHSWLVGIMTSLEPRLSVPDLSHSFLEKRYKIWCRRAGCPPVQNVPPRTSCPRAQCPPGHYALVQNVPPHSSCWPGCTREQWKGQVSLKCRAVWNLYVVSEKDVCIHCCLRLPCKIQTKSCYMNAKALCRQELSGKSVRLVIGRSRV